jgi:uncharacterized protein
MSTYMTPGVYVEEIPARSKPIEGVSTSTAAFIGLAPGGPLNRPVSISNLSQFERTFSDPENPEEGPFLRGAFLAHAVRGFFTNGGTSCWVVRVGGVAGESRAAVPAKDKPKTTVLKATANPDVSEEVRLELTLDSPLLARHNGTHNDAAGAQGESGQAAAEGTEAKQEKSGQIEAGQAAAEGTEAGQEKSGQAEAGQEGAEPAEAEQTETKQAPQLPPSRYTLVVRAGKTIHEKYDNLEASALAKAVNGELRFKKSNLITLEPQPAAKRLEPAPGTYYLNTPSMKVGEVKSKELEGNETDRRGLGGLVAIEDISMICIPDLMAIATGEDKDTTLLDIQGKVIAHCETMANRVALLDTPPDMSPKEALAWRVSTVGYDSKQATLYYPWLEVMDPLSGFPTLVPPCGHVAGVWAHTDRTRGVHKAPANEAIRAITGLGYRITSVEQEELNRSGLNCIRPFPARGIRVWGARTLSSDPEWRYLNVRRLFNHISDSIMRGTQWAVFEPNDERLWIQLQIAVGNFLTIQWRSGALFGSTPDQAFYVKCDSETNPPEMIEAGQVVTEVGIAPVKPAEFVVFRINQYTAGEGAA